VETTYEQALLDAIAEFARQCDLKPHRYLKFIGD